MRIGDTLTADPCILCGGTARTVVEVMGRGYQPLTTVLCDGCGLVSHHPLPSAQELDAFYASAYRKAYKGGWRPKPKHSLRAQRSAAARTARLAPLLAPGARCLDVGASSGEFVYMMQALGFQASGIEPNDGYRRFGVEAYGIEVASKPLEPGSFGTGVFDLISLNHVFEHLADPLGALHTFRQWLAPGGLVFIEVPNLDGVRKQRMTLFHYAHVWNFSPATLTGLLARAGFVPLPGEDEGSTSLVVAATARPVAADASRNPGHASLLRQQLAQDQSLGAYVASGAPFQRRWARLKRNVDEITTTWRYRDVRAMADAVLAATPIQPGSRRAGVELAFRAPSPGTQTDAACFPGCGTSQAA